MCAVNPIWVPAAAVGVLLAIALVLAAGCRGDDDRPGLEAADAIGFDTSFFDDPVRLERMQTREERKAREKARQICPRTWQDLLAAAGLPLSTPYSQAALWRAARELAPPYFFGGEAFVRACVAAFRAYRSAPP